MTEPLFLQKDKFNALMAESQNRASEIDWSSERVSAIIESLPCRGARDLYRSSKITLLARYLTQDSKTFLSEHDFEMLRAKCFEPHENHHLFRFNFANQIAKLTPLQFDQLLRSAARAPYGNETDDLLSHAFKSSGDQNRSLYELLTDAQVDYLIETVPMDYLNELKMNCIDNYLEALNDCTRLKPHHEQALFDRVVWTEKKIYSALISCIVRQRDSAKTLFFHLDRAGASKTVKQMNSSESYRFFKNLFRLMMRYAHNADALSFLIENEKIDIDQFKKLLKFNQRFSHFTYSNGKEVMVNNLIEILETKKQLEQSILLSLKSTTSKHKI